MNSEENFGEEMQELLLSFMISDPTSYARSQAIIEEAYFTDKFRPVVRFIKGYSDEHHLLPLPEQVYAATGQMIERFDEAPQHADWYLKTVEKFCRQRALQNVVFDGPDLLAKGMAGELEKRVKEAMTITLMTDLGTSYFENPLERLQRLQDKSNFISTGWKSMDKKLHGGFTRGSLNIFAGGSGSGKSLFLQNIALNWALMGMNVVYITLELSEELVGLRIDAMVAERNTKDVYRDINDAALKIAMVAKNNALGDLRVKKLPEAGTTANVLRAYLKEYEIQTGRKPDALVVDYLDLMHPNNAKIDVSSLFTKDKYVSEELRAIGSDWDIPVVSASQLNRQSVEAQEFDHSHIAGGISKINTADNVFGIFTSTPMRERGQYQIQFLKTRSAAAVGQKLDLAYDPDTLRITDAANDNEVEERSPRRPPAGQFANKIMSTETIDPHTGEIMGGPPQAEPIRNNLNDMMARIRRQIED